MAFHEDNSTVFFTVYDSKLTRRFETPNNKTISRINRNGRQVHEQYFKAIEGMLYDIELKESDFGRQWLLWFQDGVDKFVLQLDYRSKEAKDFFSRLPNTKLDYYIRTTVFKNEKGKTQLFTKQGQSSVPSAFTLENPNGRPEMVETTDGEGKKKWDDTAQMKFYEELVAKTNETLYRLHGIPARLRSANTPEQSFSTHDAEQSDPFDFPDVDQDPDRPF
ncbi:hypothetical protein [Runella limosa]|uniref:hypothetical protein n=1 Tax=Runella limosa TaxID=370978 RepID=UPI00041B069A|nr:hypothetical protein [Runella limosa]